MKRFFLLAFLAGYAAAAAAQEFVSVGDGPAILFDAPSLKAKRLFVLSPHYPLEKVVVLASWVKVRDNNGNLFWVEKSALGDKHYVMVSVPVADVRQSASPDAPLVFQAKEKVLLGISSAPANGWIGVLHQDGQGGYVKASQVWGG